MPGATDGVTFVSRHNFPTSDEGKFAKKLLDTFDRNSFSVQFLARFATVPTGEHLRGRLLDFAGAIIHSLAQINQTSPDAVTHEAAKMQKKLDSKS